MMNQCWRSGRSFLEVLRERCVGKEVRFTPRGSQVSFDADRQEESVILSPIATRATASTAREVAIYDRPTAMKLVGLAEASMTEEPGGYSGRKRKINFKPYVPQSSETESVCPSCGSLALVGSEYLSVMADQVEIRRAATCTRKGSKRAPRCPGFIVDARPVAKVDVAFIQMSLAEHKAILGANLNAS